MSRITFPDILAKIGLSPHKSRLHVAHAAAQSGMELMHRYWIGSFALLFLAIGALGIQVGGTYWSDHLVSRIESRAKPVSAAKLPARSIAGFNITVPAAQLQSKLQSVTSQPVTLAVGPHSEQLNNDIIKSWLQITANKNKTEYYIHTNEAAMSSSLLKEAGTYVRAPVNQVTVNEDGTSVVTVSGRNGATLSDPDSLKTQARQVAKNVLDGKGLRFNTPLADTPFQAVTPAAFDKVLVVNLTSKKMWAYQNGQLVKTFLVSAGAPATPTPVGEYHVYAKYSVQDMSGYNPNGTKYFQPRVPWVNYFTAGNAVHGVYWHPLSWFGAINSSHGCVGIPVDQAKWVYDWAPIGTTVITHA